MNYQLRALRAAILLIFCAAIAVEINGRAFAQSQADAGLNSSGAMMGVTPQRTNVYSTRELDTTPSELWNSVKLYGVKETVDYSYDNGGLKFDFSTAIYSRYTQPILVGGLIYFSVSADNGYLMILDATDGKVKERYAVDNFISPLAMAGGVIYVGASGGKFLTFDTRTKRSIWQVNLKGYHFDYASPLVSGGVVYFSGYKRQSIDESARATGIFYAVDAASGKELWTVKVKGRPTSAAMDAGLVCFGDEEKNLIALDGQTGQEKWRFKAGDNVTIPAILNGTVVFSDYDGVLYAVDIKTGQQKWKGKNLAKAGSILALDKGTVYFAGDGNSLFAVDAATGAQKWSFKTTKQCGVPVLTAKTVYFGCYNKLIYALDAASGQLKWQYKTSVPVTATPIVADASLYFLDGAAHLHALR